MKESYDESLEAYTHTNEEEGVQEESEDFTEKFQKGYKVFRLSSELNEANVQIQKLSIKIQKDKNRHKNMLDCITRQKDEINLKYQCLMAQFGKVNTMLEAERSARKIGSSTHKKNRQELEMISQKLGAKSVNIDDILGVIQQFKNQRVKEAQRMQEIRLQLQTILNEKKQQQRSFKQSKQRQIKKNKQQLEKKIASLQAELNQQKIRTRLKETIQKKLDDANGKKQKLQLKLEEYQSELSQKNRQIENLRNSNALKQEQLRGLRVKYELWLISKQKSRDDKIKYDQKVQQMQFQLNLIQKKRDLLEQRYEQEMKKTSRFQKLIRQKQQQINKLKNDYIQQEDRFQQINKNLYISQIYKQKYQKSQLKAKEVEQRALNFANIAEQYAQQIHSMQEALSQAERNSNQTFDQIQRLKKLVQQHEVQLNAQNLIISHQTQLLQQKNTENAGLKAEINELNKKIAYFQVQLQTKKKENLKFVCGQDFINQIKGQISEHYNKLLEDEMKGKKALQLEVYQAKMKIIQLKSQLSQHRQKFAELKQDRQLIFHENQRLLKSQSEAQRYQERRILEIRDRYREMNKVKSQGSFKALKKLKIDFCFNYVLSGEYRRPSYSTEDRYSSNRFLNIKENNEILRIELNN